MLTFTGIPMPVWMKFAICVSADLFDMTVGRLLIGVGIFGDAGATLINFLLWGPLGLLSIWEMADVTEQFDGFVPTHTLIAWAAYRRQAQSLETTR